MSLALESPSRVRLLGGDLDLLTPSNLLAFIAECIEDGRKAIIANHNAHSLALIRRDPEMDAFYRMADLVEIDSMPLIAWGRAMGAPLGRRHRCTYLGWRAQFWSAAEENGWRVFYLGGASHVAEKAAERIRQVWPEVEIGVHHGFFEKSASSAANEEVIRTIRNFAPDILFVGLGMPLQEKWIAANHRRFDHGVMIPVGAAFDYEAGTQVTPPRWIGRLGLEW
ncbi:MAG: WecB/TagA/CpsF family glycosyltransferase, partial [Caulobacteraceae bacterium]